MNIKAANTILYCRNWKETVRFYRDILGLEMLFSNDWFVEFSLNNHARLSIADETRATVKSSQGKGITISLQVEHLQKIFPYLEEKGYEPSPIKEIWGNKQFFVFDPEGNRIEFWTL
jgi:catechol 2,3-dioxygenase-like lactoylglutathione lyase family enzyme